MESKNEIEINGETYIKKSAIDNKSFNATNTEGLPYVICRGYYCGVHAGYLKEHDGNHATLVNSRRLWSWKAKEGISLSAVAKHGIDSSCSLPNSLEEIWLGDVYEVIPCTEKARDSIMEADVREQN